MRSGRLFILCINQKKKKKKKAYNNIIKSIQKKKYKNEMHTIFMNSENSENSEYHILVLKLTDK